MSNTTPQQTILTLEDMTIYEAMTLQKQFLEALQEYQYIEVNLAKVTEIDCAGLQLMIALKREAIKQGKSMVFSGHSHEVIAFLDLFNMTQFFGDPVVLGK